MVARLLLSGLLLGGLELAVCFGRLSDQLHSAARGLQDAVGSVTGGGDTSERAQQLSSCKDEHASCANWAKYGECDKNPSFMHATCLASCYMCESLGCHDSHDECSEWAIAGECTKNDDFMASDCTFSCGFCGVSYEPQCRRNARMKPAAIPGTIDATFERAIRAFPQYGAKLLKRDPWILHFEHFLSPKEVDKLLPKAGHSFERSLAGDGVTPVRTSATSWCNVAYCLDDPFLQQVRSRIANVTRVPWEYAEHLQTLKYLPGQFYREHHDQNAPRNSAWGPRLYTFFIYLSDVEAGGETRFTRLNISVTPRKGSAILWPSVLSEDPFVTDERTFHEAVTVDKGIKFSANFWIHMYEFQQVFLLFILFSLCLPISSSISLPMLLIYVCIYVCIYIHVYTCFLSTIRRSSLDAGTRITSRGTRRRSCRPDSSRPCARDRTLSAQPKQPTQGSRSQARSRQKRRKRRRQWRLAWVLPRTGCSGHIAGGRYRYSACGSRGCFWRRFFGRHR